MAVSIDWDTARSVAARVSNEDGFHESYRADGLRADMAELTPQAEKLVERETGLVSLAGPARARVVDRSEWVDANLASFDRLVRPLLEKLSPEKDDDPDAEPSTIGQFLEPLGDLITSATNRVGPKVAGGELGLMLGWMSKRVIGQYDLLVAEDDNPEDQDWVYYVGPNMVALEQRYGFPPEEFRLWVAIHECTHRAQFTGVPWLRDHFVGLVHQLIDTVDPDPKRFAESLKRIVEQKRRGEAVLDGGISAALATPEQQAILDQVTGLMSLLEGHGDIIMDRAGESLIPSQPRFQRVFAQRRASSSGPARLIQRLLGFEAKMAQYVEGEKFVAAVENAGGPELFGRVWERPENLPDGQEIRDPNLWIQRMS